MNIASRTWLSRILATIPALLIAVLVIVPFAEMLSRFLDFSSIGALGGSSPIALLTRRAIENSLVQGMLSAATSFAVGLPLGFFLGRYEFRFKRLLRSFAILPIFLPSIVVVTAFISSFGPGSPTHAIYSGSTIFSTGLSGIVAVNTFFNAPLVAMMTMLSVERSNRTLDEAAMTLGASGMRRFISVWGRDGIIAGAGGSLLAFLYSFAGFTAPLIIGGPGYFTLEAWIYFMVRTLNNIPLAAVMSLVEAGALLLPAVFYFAFIGGTKRVYGTGRPPAEENRKHSPFFISGALYVAAWTGLECYILGSVFYSSLRLGQSSPGFGNFVLLFSTRTTVALGLPTSAVLLNTMFYGIMTSLLVTLIGLVWIYGKRRAASRALIVTDTVQFIPLVISAVIFSLSLAVTFEYTTSFAFDWILIIIAQSVLAIPIVLRVMEAGFSAIPPSYTEAALTLRGNPFFEVEVPIARSTLASALMFGFAMSLGEFTATNFLATTSYIPLGVQIYQLQVLRIFGAAEAAAAILLLMSLASFYVVQRAGEVFVAVR